MFENKNFVTIARAFVLNDENKILLVKHTEKWKWVLPWWHRENDESPHETVIRELWEEFQIKVEFVWNPWKTSDSVKLLPLPLDNYIISYFHNSEEINKVEYIFLVKYFWEKLVPLENEIFDYKYFSLEEIENENFDTFSRFKELIEKIREKIF